MRPDQLGDYRVPSDAHLHPDGDTVAFVVTQMDLEADEYVSSIWMLDGDVARPFTTGRRDRSPRWSSDGSTLAFLRTEGAQDPGAQLALMPFGGGEATVVTSLDIGVSDFAWSPEGDRIALVAAEHVDGIDDDDERARRPRRIHHPAFRFDDKGWQYDRRAHLWILDVTTGALTPLTGGDHDEGSPAWSPDGETIAYLSAADDDRWLDPRGYVFTVPAAGGQPLRMTGRGSWSWVGYGPDGSLFALGDELDRMRLDALPLQRLGRDGLERITDLDRNLMPGHPPGVLAGPRFLDDGTVHCVLEDQGTERVVEIHPDGSVEPVVGGRRVVTGWDPRPNGSGAVFTATTPTNPGEVYRWDGTGERQVTDLNGDFRRNAALVEPAEFTFESEPGVDIHGWVLLPPGDGDVPLLLNVHGGPATQYGWGFFDEFQVYVGAGYGVVAVNPRGSSGYGDTHVKTPQGRWGDEIPPDHADLMRAPDAAAQRFPRLDLDRLGIMGGSYGGLSTVMLTSMDQRYRSAVAERGVYNWVSFAGTTDIPWFVPLYLDADMVDGADILWPASTLRRVREVTTPTLVIHSEGDHRCHVEQAQQLFMQLYRQGTKTELLLFPENEGHEMSRSGTPRHRVERFEAILEWHGAHIGG
ncbi:MAG: S9 family peptidase [Acidimicrobiia bacterium]|nr:S9 family peptidase [Acidimicrobiia bacterium]